MAELLLDLELDDEPREFTENIYRSANALLTVINDILDFSKVESGRLDIEEVQFSLSVIVHDVSKMLNFAAERKNLDFRSDIAPGIAKDMVVLGDPGRVRQIITNLLTNSIKFTAQGFVRFSVYKEKETVDTIEIKFVVEDSGVGIDDDVRKRLFQPFSQGDASTARKFGGTGLGLTICKNLLDLMHGRMTLESRVGIGTTATFWIPFHKPQGSRGANLVEIDGLPGRLASEVSVSCSSSDFEQAIDTPPGEPGPGALGKSRSPRRALSAGISTGASMGSISAVPSSHGAVSGPSHPVEDMAAADRAQLHVLVVEDNHINQQIALKTIKKLGFQVSAVWNGKEALAYLADARDGKERKPDIILMDIQMPQMDGYKCTHLLRHHLPYKAAYNSVPIVAMTASAIQGDKEKCEKAGMDDYLAKPVKSKTLERMLVRWGIHRRQGGDSTRLAHVSEYSEDCSNASEHCDNAVIPGVGHDAVCGTLLTPMAVPQFTSEVRGLVPLTVAAASDDSDRPDDKPNLPTPRAPANGTENQAHFPGYTLSAEEAHAPLQADRARAEERSHGQADDNAQSMPYRSDGKLQQLRRRESEERARQSRDDKLLDSAGQASHSLASPLGSPGQSLTEENVERLAEEIAEDDEIKKRTGK